jgi:Flp pilus assembly protein TadD
MSDERLRSLRQMAQARPEDARLRFGLAVELLNRGETREGADVLRAYLGLAEDEGNGWARLGAALVELEEMEGAREAYTKGLAAAQRRGHESMVEEIEEALEDLT